ncbi:probable Tectonin beta-propeller repeat-containing protein 1 at N-terminal half [Coccomyxa sp. Obi]|nr:probable Tectonin beta-propeller repeat-containing protein 1 at N-terminal half [Coccomyxa sp. Obi]
MTSKKTFEEQWPRWPSNYEAPLQLVDIRVKLPVDHLFNLLYAAGSEFVAQSHEVRGNKDCVETPWLASEEEVDLAQPSPPVPKELQEHTLGAADHKGMVRKTSCSSFGMGMKFRTEEVQRCLEAQSGSHYEVEVCVATTATYGDKFRGVCRHRLRADGQNWSTWKAEFALVYVAPVNGLLKKAIEKGSAGGLAKNFATLVDVLGEFGEVTKPQQERAQDMPVEVPRPQPQQRVLGILDEGFVRLFEPLAARITWTSSRQGAVSQELSRTASAIAVVVLLVTLQCFLALVRMALAFFRINPGWLGIPGSISGVVFSIAVFVLAQRGAPLVAAAVPWMGSRLPVSWNLRRNSRSLPTGTDTDDAPAKGTRFEGFDAALESANAEITSGEQELRAASLANLALQRTAPAREQLRTGVRGFQKLMADSWTAGRRRMANGALTPERAISPARPHESDNRLGRSRGSSPLLTSPISDREEGRTLFDDALPQRSPSTRRRRGDKRSEKALVKSFNAAARGSGDDSDPPRSVEMSAMGPRPASFTSQTSSMIEAEEIGPVEAEVFENERFLPFRGWGHQWPGHLLPTDRVGHWSLRGDVPSGAESMDFHNVAPKLREGWEWLEEDWHIDMTGHEDGCVDDEGWYYAVDFNWLKHPPPPGAGRFKRVRDYVRRRRWVRTRVRSEAMMTTSSALQRLASLSQPPPLLPLTQLLGDMAITPETHPKRRDAAPSPQPGTSIEPQARQPFELRPTGVPSTSMELQTPRLVMGSGAEHSPLPRAEERPVVVHISVASAGDAAHEAGYVTVRLALRQAQAAPSPSLSLSEQSVQLSAPAEMGFGPGRPVAAPETVAHGANHGAASESAATVGGLQSITVPAAAPQVASQAGDSAKQTNKVADPFAAAASAADEQGSISRSALSERTDGERDVADFAGGLLNAELEQVELQIAASMQPSSHDSREGDVLAATHLHQSTEPSAHLPEAVQVTIAEAGGASSEQGGDRPADALSGDRMVERGQEAAGQHEAAQPVPVSSLRGAGDGVGAGHAHAKVPSTTLSEEHSVGLASEEALPGKLSDRVSAVEEEGADAEPHGSTGPQEQADWEHIRSASDDDTDDSGVVVHHEQVSQPEENTLEPAESTTGSFHDEQTKDQEDKSGGDVIEDTSTCTDAVAQSASAPHTVEERLLEPSSSAAASAGPSSDTSIPDKADRQVTPERKRHEGLHFFPRPGGESSPGPSPVAVDWSQIGNVSGRLAAMAGDSLRKGFAQAASHASHAARQSGKGDGRPLSPPGQKPPDQPSRGGGTPPGKEQQAGGPSFLQTLKSRGEQSLHAARSVLSSESTGPRPDSAASTSGSEPAAEGEHAALGSMRGMFSDLKRTMERVGHAAPLMNMASFGKQDTALTGSSSDVGEHVLMEARRPNLNTNKSSDPHQPANNLTESSAADGEPAVIE